MIRVQITGTLVLDDEIAQVLNDMMSYNLHEYFSDKCSKQYTKEKLSEILQRIKSQLYPIILARKDAVEAINNRLRPPKTDPGKEAYHKSFLEYCKTHNPDGTKIRTKK